MNIIGVAISGFLNLFVTYSQYIEDALAPLSVHFSENFSFSIKIVNRMSEHRFPPCVCCSAERVWRSEPDQAVLVCGLLYVKNLAAYF